MLIDEKVWNRLSDDESKYWYQAWIEFAFHRDRFLFYEKVYEKNPNFWGGDLKTLENDNYKNRPFIIYGTGKVARHDYHILKYGGLLNRLVAFANSSVKDGSNEKFLDYPVVSPVELLEKYSDHIVIVGSIDYSDEIYRQLARMGFPQQNIYYPPYQRMMAAPKGNQYFDVFSPDGGEIFIDAGCYDAKTSLAFVKWCNGDYEKIYAFEASPMRRKICRDAFLKSGVKYELIEKACWSGEGEIDFCGNRLQNTFGGAGVLERRNSESISVPTGSIDQIFSGGVESPIFIKMDLEGAELEALKGARNTIQKYRPKLAISMYHKFTDVVDLPSYLLSLKPDYKFYIRHYSSDIQETVLYAK